MPSQRIRIIKIAGPAATIITAQIRTLAAARATKDPYEWSTEQWPTSKRGEIGALIESLSKGSRAALPRLPMHVRDSL